MAKVSSHGGHTEEVQGANYGGRKEHLMDRELNSLFISKLRNLGHDVKDDTYNGGGTPSQVVNAQIRNINSRYNDVGFSWHLNASNGQGHGVEVLCYSQNEAQVAARISAAIAKRTGWKDRGVKIRPDIGVIRETKCPVFLIEAGFIDNDSDMAKWNPEAIVNGVIEGYFGTNLGSGEAPKPPSQPHKQNIISTGAFHRDDVPLFMQALASVKVTGRFYLNPEGLTYCETESMNEVQMKAMKDWLASAHPNWWYEVK